MLQYYNMQYTVIHVRVIARQSSDIFLEHSVHLQDALAIFLFHNERV